MTIQWLARMRAAIQARKKEVLMDEAMSPDSKEWKLANLSKADHRLQRVEAQIDRNGLTPELKTEVIQALIEGDSADLFGY